MKKDLGSSIKRGAFLLKPIQDAKSFVFPNDFKRPRSVKSFSVSIKKNQNFNSSNIYMTENESIINITYNDITEPIVHTYALPSRLLTHNKSEKSPNYSKFNKSIQNIMKRFQKNKNLEHIVKVERKGVQGWKKKTKIFLNCSTQLIKLPKTTLSLKKQ